MNNDDIELIVPDWPAPAHVFAAISTRQGGVSMAPFDSLNLGLHVGDEPLAVAENRQRLLRALGRLAPCGEAQWLSQVHGTTVVEAEPDAARRKAWVPDADAVTTMQTGLPCVVMTADCLPVLFCDTAGQRVAVAHAGWRGLCDGVLEATLATFDDRTQVLCYLGPAIGPARFEVGAEVRAAFVGHQAEAEACFVATGQPGKFLADIYALARLRLAGVAGIYGGDFCTVSDASRFFSYRRDGRSGRMASVIWLAG